MWALDVLAYMHRGLYKLLLGKWKYGRGRDYDAQRYWTDRFKKYGYSSLRGPGHEGLSEAENSRMYSEAAEAFVAFCQENGVSFRDKRVLEIGCGTGFYTGIISTLGGENLEFVGADITDAMFPELQACFPSFTFFRWDISKPLPEMAPFDQIVMIDVVQHIVTEEGFRTAMDNIKRLLAPGGVFIVAPIAPRKRRELFYVHWWPLEAFQETFPGYRMGQPRPFRRHNIVAIARERKVQT